MNSSDNLHRIIVSIFKYSMIVIFFLLILFTSVVSNLIKRIEEENIEYVEGSIKHSVNLERRFILEEYLSGSFEAMNYRLKRITNKIQGVNVSISYNKVLELGHCVEFCRSFKYEINTPDSDVIKLDVHYKLANENSFTNLNKVLEYSFVAIVVFLMLLSYVVKLLYKSILIPIISQVIESEQTRKQELINKQIVHDIRSPVEALRALTSEIKNLDYNAKNMLNTSIGRIIDIANNLLKDNVEGLSSASTVNLRILLENIILDKNFERSVEIKVLTKLSYSDSFVIVVENQIYRAISNLINNALESSSTESEIFIKLIKKGFDQIAVYIVDSGIGMDAVTVSKALSGGFTSKSQGHGLGLSSSKRIVEINNGSLNVLSEPNKGTEVEVCFKSVLQPEWFSDNLHVNKSAITCIDDDFSFIELYKAKLKKYKLHSNYFNSISEVSVDRESCYFIDYDLGCNVSGLDFIISNELSSQSTLVTSMYQDEDIQKRCVEHGVRMLPKQIFNNAKVIDLRKENKLSTTSSRYALIDDDEIIHMSWNMEAEKADVKLDCFLTVAEFLAVSDEYDEDVVVYIDSNLADGVKGEIESEKIFNSGFKNIYLATGYSPSDFEKPSWIKEIVGKRAKFN